MWRDLRICKYMTPLNRTRARDRRHIVVVAELVSFFPDTFTCTPHNSKYHARNNSRYAGMQSVSVTLLSCFSIIDKQNADTVWYFRQHQLGHHICRFYGFIQRPRTPNGIPIIMWWLRRDAGDHSMSFQPSLDGGHFECPPGGGAYHALYAGSFVQRW